MFERSCIAKLAYKFLNDLEKNHVKGTELSEENLVKLYSLFGDVFTNAVKLAENCSIIEYRTSETPSSSSKLKNKENNSCSNHIPREIYKLIDGSSTNQQYTIYKNLNYCQCEEFRVGVVQNREKIFCEHVLAFKLNELTGICEVKLERITDLQFTAFLNEQIDELL